MFEIVGRFVRMLKLHYKCNIWLHVNNSCDLCKLQNLEAEVDQFDTVRSVKQQHEVHVGE